MSSQPVDVRLSCRLASVRPCTTGGITDTARRMKEPDRPVLAPRIRLAYALSDADLKAACERIVAACKRPVPA